MICRRNPFENKPIPPLKNGAAHQQSNRTAPHHRTGGVSYFHMEEQERRYFYALMSRSRGKNSLDFNGFTGAFLTGQRIDTFPLKNGVLLRDKSTEKE